MEPKALLVWADHTEAQHFGWLKQVDPDLPDLSTWPKYYDLTTDLARRKLDDSDEWKQISQALTTAEVKYRSSWSSALVVQRPELVRKSFASVRSKVYRLNVAERLARGLGEPATAERISPVNWYSSLGDVIRCTIVVSMMDGVSPVCSAIAGELEALEMPCEWRYRSHKRGYYAAHLTFSYPATIVSADPPPMIGQIDVEIQVKTYLHHVLGQLTHTDYENKRAVPEALDSEDWIWDPGSPLFHPRMLGHVAHYLDGAILSIRSERKK